MVKFIAGILSSPVLNSINFPPSSNSEYSKFKRLCKSVVSNPNAKCLAAIGYFESVTQYTAFVQCDAFFKFFHPSISEVYITPVPLNIFPLIKICLVLFNPFVVINITFVSCCTEKLNKRLFAMNLYLYLLA